MMILTDDEVDSLATLHAALEQHGIVESGAAYDAATLAASIYARGWSYSVDRSGADYQATVVITRDATHGTRVVRVGWSVEVALAFALVAAIDQAAHGQADTQIGVALPHRPGDETVRRVIKGDQPQWPRPS
jgi:hypothetical protein